MRVLTETEAKEIENGRSLDIETLADTELLDDLTRRGYLKIVDEDASWTYRAITPKGELALRCHAALKASIRL